MSQILCCPVAWILELRSILCLLQTRPSRRVDWYCTIYFHLFILYIQRYGNIPLKIYLWTLGWEPLAQQHTESAIFLPETFLNSRVQEKLDWRLKGLITLHRGLAPVINCSSRWTIKMGEGGWLHNPDGRLCRTRDGSNFKRSWRGYVAVWIIIIASQNDHLHTAA